jgi:hypothetical protein
MIKVDKAKLIESSSLVIKPPTALREKTGTEGSSNMNKYTTSPKKVASGGPSKNNFVGTTYYEVKTTAPAQLSSHQEEINEDSSNLYSFKGRPADRGESRSSLTYLTSKSKDSTKERQVIVKQAGNNFAKQRASESAQTKNQTNFTRYY